MATEHRGEKFHRVEDDALVSGQGRFVDDIAREGVAYVVFVRAPHAFARITSISTDDARKAPGVLALLTADDMSKAGIGNVARHPPIPGRGGAKMALSHRPALASGHVRHIGEPVAMIVASTQLAAQDAAELVAVDYEEMPAVTDVREADKPGAPQIFPDIAGNLALDWPGMAADPDANAREVDAIIKAAAHVARVTVTQQRLVVAALEPRGATATYDKAADRYTLRVCSQGAGPLRDQLIGAMNIPKEKLRVVTEDVGGAFGMKSGTYPEYVALLVAAKQTDRTVHWMSEPVGGFRQRQPGARRDHRCGTGARRARQVSCAAGPSSAKPGRLCRLRRHRSRHDQFRAAAFRRSIASRASISQRAASTPTRSRPAPIAAPAGPRRITSPSG